MNLNQWLGIDQETDLLVNPRTAQGTFVPKPYTEHVGTFRVSRSVERETREEVPYGAVVTRWRRAVWVEKQMPCYIKHGIFFPTFPSRAERETWEIVDRDGVPIDVPTRSERR